MSSVSQLPPPLRPELLSSSPCYAKSLYPIPDHELAFLVLQYLKENKFTNSYESFLSESSNLTGSLVNHYKNNPYLHHHKPKSLWAILSEYISLQQDQHARYSLLQLNNSTNSLPGKVTESQLLFNPLGTQMQQTFAALNDLLSDYQTLKQSLISSVSPSQSNSNTSTSKYIKKNTTSKPKQLQKSNNIGTSVNTIQMPESLSPIPTTIDLSQPTPVKENKENRTLISSPVPSPASFHLQQTALPRPDNISPQRVPLPNRRKSPFPKRLQKSGSGKQVGELISRLTNNLNERIPELDTPDSIHMLSDELSSMLAEDLRYKDLFDSVPCFDIGTVKDLRSENITNTSPLSSLGKRTRPEGIYESRNEPPPKKQNTDDSEKNSQPALPDTLDVDAFLQTLKYS